MILPYDRRKFLNVALDMIDTCRISCDARAEQAKSLKRWRYAGSPSGDAAIYNRLQPHCDRLAGYLFSPSNLRFDIEFENGYPREILDQAAAVARVLTRTFSRRDIDMQCSEAVDISLTYGTAVIKTLWDHNGLRARIVMPWQFGVRQENEQDLLSQEAVLETSYISIYDLWRRIQHLPNAIELYRKARSYAQRQSAGDGGDDYFHQVLLAGIQPAVQTNQPYANQPGGLVQMSPDPMGAIVAPTVAGELIRFHELWVKDDDTGDYVTIQIAEPDILIAPQFRRRNLFVPETLPYTVIQPNRYPGYFWGVSEISQLLRLQMLLRERMEDLRRLMSLQYDRLLGFVGFSDMNDERYDQFRQAGWFSSPDAGGKIEDLTPPVPDHAFEEINMIVGFMDEAAGFQNILSGQGEQGVRAGVHAETLLKTASPRLRDRALLVERQVADVGEKCLGAMAAKDARVVWSDDGMNPAREFLMSQLPDDRSVVVDSHSSSPIYEQDHREQVAFLSKIGAIGAENVIDLLSVPNRDKLKADARELAKAKTKEQEFLITHPDAAKALRGAGHRH